MTVPDGITVATVRCSHGYVGGHWWCSKCDKTVGCRVDCMNDHKPHHAKCDDAHKVLFRNDVVVNKCEECDGTGIYVEHDYSTEELGCLTCMGLGWVYPEGTEARWLCQYPELNDDQCLLDYRPELTYSPSKHIQCGWFLTVPKETS